MGALDNKAGPHCELIQFKLVTQLAALVCPTIVRRWQAAKRIFGIPTMLACQVKVGRAVLPVCSKVWKHGWRLLCEVQQVAGKWRQVSW